MPDWSRWWPQRHWIPARSRGVVGFGIRVRARWWPPFAATEFLAPRYEVRIRNADKPFDNVRLQVAVSPYSGWLEDLPSLPNQWRPVVSPPGGGEYRDLGPVRPGEELTAHITIPTGSLNEGQHVVRFHILTSPAPTAPPGINGTFGWLQEYLRVEPISTVLTMAIATGSFLAALATLALVLTQ